MKRAEHMAQIAYMEGALCQLVGKLDSPDRCNNVAVLRSSMRSGEFGVLIRQDTSDRTCNGRWYSYSQMFPGMLIAR